MDGADGGGSDGSRSGDWLPNQLGLGLVECDTVPKLVEVLLDMAMLYKEYKTSCGSFFFFNQRDPWQI
jgi:hypothetical protein